MITNPPKGERCVTEQLQLFDQRLPRKPYCADDLSAGLQIRPANIATRRRYIQVNPPWLRSWIVMDVDRAGAVLAWDDADLPIPAWSSMNPVNRHAHLAWGIEAPVLLGQHDRQKPMRFLAAVESAITAKLEADPNYSGLITKNPKHPDWITAWAPPNAGVYDLGYLSEWLNLPKHLPRERPERVGIGRNVDAFDYLRKRAYREVRDWKRANGRGAFVYWQKYLYDLVLDYTGLEHPAPLDYREAHHIARSVAKWVWRNFDIAASDARFSALQARRGRAGGLASGSSRRQSTEQQRATARMLRAKGMSIRAIADELGAAKSTVSDWVSHEA